MVYTKFTNVAMSCVLETHVVQCLSFHPISWPQTSLGSVLRLILKFIMRMATYILNEILLTNKSW
jgi:hypothetical protein